jgi:ribosome-associated protein
LDSGQERAIRAAQAAAKRKAYDIKVLDLTGIFPVADYFMICTGRSTTQLAAIQQEVEDELKNASESYRKLKVLQSCSDALLCIWLRKQFSCF